MTRGKASASAHLPESFQQLLERWERFARVKNARLEDQHSAVVPPFRAAFIGKPGRGQDPALAELLRVLGETRDPPGDGEDPPEGLRTIGVLLGRLSQKIDYLGNWGKMTSFDRAPREAQFVSDLGFPGGLGGLLVIDVDRKLELLSVVKDLLADPGKEVEFRWERGVDTLRAVIQEPWAAPAVLLVGDRDLELLLNNNLDLKAEFGPNTIRFRPLTVDQAQGLAEEMLEEHGFKLSPGSREKLKEGLVRLPEEANYRSVSKLAVTIAANQAARIRAPLRKGKPIGTLYDLEAEDIPLDDGMVTKEEVLARFDQLVGLDEIKEELKRLVDLAEARNRRRKEGGTVGASNRNYHFIFRGPPGTGKTTVARLMGDLFFTAGLLPKGHLIERDRAGLVGRYLGQSEINLAEAVDDAQGGVLFIDEAYALGSKEDGDDKPDQYGQAVINALVQRLYESPGSFSCVIAGYGDEMRDFLRTNDGLSSRFNHELVFPSFSAEELVGVAIDRVEGSGLKADGGQDSAAGIEPTMQKLIDTANPKSFGNARTAIEIADRAIESALLADRDQVEIEDFEEAIEHAIGVELARQNTDGGGPSIKGPASEKAIEKALACLGEFETTAESDRKNVELLIESFRHDEPRAGFVNGLPRGIADFVFCSGESPTSTKLEMAEAIVALYEEVGLLPSADVKVVDPSEWKDDASEPLDQLFESASGSGALLIPDLEALLGAISDGSPASQELAVTNLVDLIHRHRNDLALFLGASNPESSQDPGINRLLKEFEYRL